MAKHYTIARPYARAVFKQAVGDGQLEEWSSLMQGLVLIAKDTRVIQMWQDPKVTNKALIDLFCQVLESSLSEVTKPLGDKWKNLIALLVAGKRLVILGDIDDLYHKFLAEYRNIIAVDVISAYPLNDAQQKRFYVALEKRFASKASIDFKRDEDLIGCVLLRSGNWVLDDSIRSKVSRLGESLLN